MIQKSYFSNNFQIWSRIENVSKTVSKFKIESQAFSFKVEKFQFEVKLFSGFRTFSTLTTP
jgi:hypothetical protein